MNNNEKQKFKNILERLHTLRKKCNLRQEDVATRLGIARTTYVRKEKGIIPINTEEWIKLSKIFNVDIVCFFNNLEK